MNAPECPLGYPWSQLERELDAQQLARLQLWMNGQTGAICEETLWHHTGEYEGKPELPGFYYWGPCRGTPHGAVVYSWDFARWLRADPIID